MEKINSVEINQKGVSNKSKQKFKLQKSTPYIAAFVAGVMILIGSCNLLSKSTGKTHLSFFNNYRFNIEDFDSLVVPSFSVEEEADTYNFNGEGTMDENFTIKLNDGNYIMAPYDSALLIDNDFKPRKSNKLSKELGSFTKAKVNFFGETKDMLINGISIEQIDGETFYILDTILGVDSVPENEAGIKRILGTPENIVLYNELDPEEAKEKYKDSVRDFDVANLIINNNLNTISNIYGYKELEINGINYILIGGEMRNEDLCAEFLISKNNCIFHRTLSIDDDWDMEVPGIPMQAEGAKGLYGMQYEIDNFNQIATYEIKKLGLTEDGFYHLIDFTSSGRLIYSVYPAKHLALEYGGETRLETINYEDEMEFGGHCMFFDNISYEKPISPLYFPKRVRIGDNYFYVGKGLGIPFSQPKVEWHRRDEFDAIYSIESIAYLTFGYNYEKERDNHVIAPGKFDVVYHINNNSFWEGEEEDLIGLRRITIQGVDYYSVLISRDFNDGRGPRYSEIFVPIDKLLIKSAEEAIVKVKNRSN